MSAPWFHFEDIEGNLISEHDFGDVQRGKDSDIFKLYVVNDGDYNISNVGLEVLDGVYPQLALPETEHFSNSINFPLSVGDKQLVKVKLALLSTTPLGGDTGVLRGSISLSDDINSGTVDRHADLRALINVDYPFTDLKATITVIRPG